MPLDLIVDSLDSVKDESVKALYKEADGKYALDTDAYAEFVKKPLIGKNAELKREKDRLKALEKFKDVDDDTWTKFSQWRESSNEDDDDDAGDDKGKQGQVDVKKLIKAELKKAEEAFKKQIEAKDAEIKAERGKFDQFNFELGLAQLVSGVEDHLPMVYPERMEAFKAYNDRKRQFGYVGGKLVALDEDGDVSTETAEERLAKLADLKDWKYFFAAKEKGGGSGEQKQGGRKGDKPLKRSEMTNVQKKEAIKRLGMKGYLALPE